jgi:aclacinomycin oxidase
MSWLEFALNPLPDLFAGPPGGVSAKVKDALLRRRFTDRQIAVAYDYMTRTDHDVMGGMLGLATYGGRINTVAPDATASAQRGAILDIACNVGWLDPREEAKNLAWVRAFYRELFAETGGVPVPGEAYDGAFINHPDTDLADPAREYVGRALAHAVLPRQLPATAANQGAVGSSECVPASPVHSCWVTGCCWLSPWDGGDP